MRAEVANTPTLKYAWCPLTELGLKKISKMAGYPFKIHYSDTGLG